MFEQSMQVIQLPPGSMSYSQQMIHIRNIYTKYYTQGFPSEWSKMESFLAPTRLYVIAAGLLRQLLRNYPEESQLNQVVVV